MRALTLDDVVSRCETILAALAGAEVLAMDEAAGQCFSLSGSGAAIWEAAAQPVRIGDICAALRRRYRVDEETCAQETLAYVALLVQEGLLTVAPRQG